MNSYYRTVMREKTKARDVRQKCGGEPDIFKLGTPQHCESVIRRWDEIKPAILNPKAVSSNLAGGIPKLH
jgi:hypothetical protein